MKGRSGEFSNYMNILNHQIIFTVGTLLEWGILYLFVGYIWELIFGVQKVEALVRDPAYSFIKFIIFLILLPYFIGIFWLMGS